MNIKKSSQAYLQEEETIGFQTDLIFE